MGFSLNNQMDILFEISCIVELFKKGIS